VTAHPIIKIIFAQSGKENYSPAARLVWQNRSGDARHAHGAHNLVTAFCAREPILGIRLRPLPPGTGGSLIPATQSGWRDCCADARQKLISPQLPCIQGCNISTNRKLSVDRLSARKPKDRTIHSRECG